MPRVEGVRDGELEDAVAEELEALVGGDPVVRPRGMSEDRLRRLVGQRVDQPDEALSAGYWCVVT